MGASVDFGRVISAMATPFNADGSLDLGGARALAEHLVAHGSDSLVVAGTTGEAPTLTHSEKRDLWAAVADVVRGRASLIAGTGTYSTAESIELTRTAAEAGAGGVLLVTRISGLLLSAIAVQLVADSAIAFSRQA